jgi:mannose-6-phosphate isomerase-like protein (cupin superfamily)
MTIAEQKSAVTGGYRVPVRNGAFKTSAPGREIKYRMGGVEKSVFVVAEATQTGRRTTLAVHHLAPGEESGFRMHTLEDGGFFVLEGTVTVDMPHDDLVLEAKAGEFVWHPLGRAYNITAGPEPVKVLQFLFPGADFVPHFYEELSGIETDTPEGRQAVADLAREEFGVHIYGPDSPPPSKRPAVSRGPVTPDGRMLMPEELDRMVNAPFKSDASKKYALTIDRGVMTGVELIFHAWGHQTGGAFQALEIAWSTPDMVYPHVHPMEEECFYILEGEFTLCVAEADGITEVVGRPGDFVWAPRDVPHYYHVTGDQGARVLVGFVPGDTGFLKWFYEMAVHGRGENLDTDEKFADWLEWAGRVSGQFGLAPGEWPGELPAK